MRVRLVTYAWGREHLDRLIHYAVAAALAPGNLPTIAASLDCSVVIVTEEKLFDHVHAHPIIRTLKQICAVKLVALDDLISEPWQYGITLTHALFRGFEDLGPAMTDTYLLFLNSDFVLAANSYAALLPRIRAGERAHFSPSYATIEENVTPLLENLRQPDGSLGIGHRTLADMIIDNRHNTIRAKTVNQSAYEFEYTDQFYWQVDPTTFIARQMPVSLVGVRPETVLTDLNAFWDWGLVYELCPSRKLTVIGDSDDFLMMELRHETRSVESIRLGKTSPKAVAKRTKGYITQYQIDHARLRLLLHSQDIPRQLMPSAEEGLHAHVEEVLRHLPATPLDHRGHAQWAYHKMHFRGRLHRAWRAKSRHRATGRPRGIRSSLNRLDRRVRDLANPLGSRRHPIWERLRDGAEDHPYHLLVVCAEDSGLLRNLHLMPGNHLHVTPAGILGGALRQLPKDGPRFDLCIIEISYSDPGRMWRLYEAACDRLARAGRIVLVWHSGSDVSAICAKEIAARAAVGGSDVDIWCTRSRTSTWITKLRARSTGRVRRPAGFALALFLETARIGRDFAELRLGRKKGRYVFGSIPMHADSIAVDIAAPSFHQARYLREKDAPDTHGGQAIDLAFNPMPEFTKWLVREGALREPFVVADVGVLGGENPRWHFLGDYLEVYGFDALKEAIDDLNRCDDRLHKRSYRWLAIGNEDGERQFFFDPLNPTNSSFFSSPNPSLQTRIVRMRSLDSLLREGVLPRVDFLKVDVEGFEGDVLTGAQQLLAAGVLGVECESNFASSSVYPKTHFAFVQEALMRHDLRLADLNYDRHTSAAYERERRRRNLPGRSQSLAGTPSTFNLLFCRHVGQDGETSRLRLGTTSPTVDQILKLIAIYELHGLQDIGVDIATAASDMLGQRIDVDQAIDLLCR